MDFAVLGPLIVRESGVAVDVPRAPAQLLALLLCRPNQVVGVQSLTDELWGRTDRAANRLQVVVHRLRKSLGDAERVQSDRGGYRIRVAPGELDVERFLELRRTGAEALIGEDLDRAVRLLREATELWRGEAFAGLEEMPLLGIERARLQSERLGALEDLYDAEIRHGSASAIVTELAELAAAHPLRERLTALHALGLHHCGRRAEALAVYQQARANLIEELGLEPGPELRRAQAVILSEEPVAQSIESVVPQQLPPDSGGLIGRTEELTELTRLIDEHGAASAPLVVTIDGAAGIGKTTFAVHAAHLVRRRYQDGQVFVDFRGYSAGEPVEPAAAMQAVLQALGSLPATRPTDLAEWSALFRSRLAGKRLLMLLDNVRGAEQVRPLLPAADCLLLVTSRNQLRALAVQDRAHRITLRPLTPEGAAGVLAEAVGVRRADGEPAALTQLADLCGRIPLALRIAGERASRFPGSRLDELANELADEHQRLDHLGDVDDRSSDLRAAFSWSYRTLSADDARTFRLLGLHPGGPFGLSAAVAVTGDPAVKVRRSLDHLIAHHLLEEPRPGRFKLHDLLRLYAAELVAAEDSPAAVATATRRMLDWYLHTMAVAGRILRPRAASVVVVDLADSTVAPQELDGLAEALDWFEAVRPMLLDLVQRAADRGFDDHAWKLAWAAMPFYANRLYLDEWRTVVVAGQLAAERLGDGLAVVLATNGRGVMHLAASEYDAARAAFTTALAWARRIGDHARQATCLSNLGFAEAEQGEHGRAIDYYEQALVVEAALAQDLGISHTYLNLSASHGALGNYQEALRYGDQALAYYRRHENPGYQALALSNIAEGHLSLGDFEQARAHCEQAMELFASLDAKQGKANLLTVLGKAQAALGNFDDAARAWQEAYDLDLAAGNPHAAEVKKLLDGLLNS